MRRSRLLRLIADLTLLPLVPDILPLLEAATSDERAASVRALGRLSVQSAQDAIDTLLHDPVQDVRKAARTALRNLSVREPREPRSVPTRAADGTRSWSLGGTPSDDDNGWKSRLRSIIDA
jgi:hypothetical protein